jgi:hypothetical protein
MEPVDVRARRTGMTMRRSAWAGLLVTALGAATLAGCASSGSSANAGGAGGAASSAPTSSSTSPAGVIPTGPATSSPPPGPTGTAPAVGVTVTVSGTVTQGAEPACLILRSDRGALELLSKTTDVHAGDHVTATGHVVNVMSHCMQGAPFQVDSLTIG